MNRHDDQILYILRAISYIF